MDYLGDKEIVDAFVEYLSRNRQNGLQVDRYPDKDNPNDIDAIADIFAIEHTSVDSIPKQREHSDWFERAIAGLEKDNIQLPFRLMVQIPYDGIRKGQNWSSIKNAFKHWVMHESPKLTEGRSEIENVTGVPFGFAATKSLSSKFPGLYFMRYDPGRRITPEEVRGKLESKIQKLIRYHPIYTTLLLIESNDIAFMNDDIMLELLLEALSGKLPEGIDELWFVHSDIPDNLLFENFTRSFKRQTP